MAKKRPKTVAIPTVKQLREIRERLGLSREEAAERIGYSGRTWMYWETRWEEQRPSVRAARLIWLLSDGSL